MHVSQHAPEMTCGAGKSPSSVSPSDAQSSCFSNGLRILSFVKKGYRKSSDHSELWVCVCPFLSLSLKVTQLGLIYFLKFLILEQICGFIIFNCFQIT